MTTSYQTPRRDRVAEIKIEVDGRVMAFRPPKRASVILPVLDPAESDVDRQFGAAAAMFDWIGRGLSDDDNEWLRARLVDDEDDFDIEDLTNLATMLFEQASGLPSQPSPG